MKTIEKKAEEYAKEMSAIKPFFRENTKKAYLDGYKQAEKELYTEEKVLEIVESFKYWMTNITGMSFGEWFNQVKKK